MILLAAFALPSCGREGGRGQPSLLLAVNAGVEAEGLKQAAADYQRQFGVRVEIVEYPYQSLFEKLLLALSGPTTPYDLIMLDDPWFPRFAAMNGLLELTPLYQAKGLPGPDADFLPPCLALGRYPYATGRLFALPYVGNSQLFFYRKDLFEAHHLPPPRTWEDVLASGRLIGMREKIYGYVMRGAQGNPIVADFMPLLWAYGGELLDADGRPRLDTPEALAALEFMLRLAEIAPPGYINFNADEVGAHLAQGTAVMGINWPAWIPAFEDPARSKVVGHIGYATLPGAKRPGSSAIGNWLLAIPRGSQKPAQAFDFLLWVTAREQMRLSALRGNPPTRRSLFEDKELRARFPAYPVQLQALLESRPRPRSPVWNEIENTFGTYLSQANAHQLSPREALARANRDIVQILERWKAASSSP
ncbi:MAG: ABC transporter substrate-binding protein [Candidatus Acidiferrales bacterium]